MSTSANDNNYMISPAHFNYFFTLGTVSVEQSIAAAFQLRAFKDVYVNKVNIKVFYNTFVC